MTATEQGHSERRHVHHGRTPAAWVGATIALIAFILGAIALVAGRIWVLFGIAAALLLVSPIVAFVMQKMGFGAKPRAHRGIR